MYIHIINDIILMYHKERIVDFCRNIPVRNASAPIHSAHPKIDQFHLLRTWLLWVKSATYFWTQGWVSFSIKPCETIFLNHTPYISIHKQTYEPHQFSNHPQMDKHVCAVVRPFKSKPSIGAWCFCKKNVLKGQVAMCHPQIMEPPVPNSPRWPTLRYRGISSRSFLPGK